MSNKYLVKKNPELPGSEDNWIIMNFEQFKAFLGTEEGQRRRNSFEILGNADDEAGAIYMEFSCREDALEIRRERYHSEYLKEQEKESGYITVPLDLTPDRAEAGEMISILELAGDEDMDTAEMAIGGLLKAELTAAMEGLSEPERELILSFYLRGEKMTENRYAKLTGCSRRCIRERHKSALRKLRLHYRLKRLI